MIEVLAEHVVHLVTADLSVHRKGRGGLGRGRLECGYVWNLAELFQYAKLSSVVLVLEVSETFYILNRWDCVELCWKLR